MCSFKETPNLMDIFCVVNILRAGSNPVYTLKSHMVLLSLLVWKLYVGSSVVLITIEALKSRNFV
jgi:hypothetical protein